MTEEQPFVPYDPDMPYLEDSAPQEGGLPPEEDLVSMMEEQVMDSEEQQEEDFYRNLAEDLTPEERKALAARLLEDLEADEASRAPWLEGIELIYKNMGFTIEEFINPGDGKKCNVTDPTFSIAWVVASSNLFSALYPPEGPCKAKILGQPTPAAEDKGARMKMWTNHYLVDKDKDYYPDSRLKIGYMVLCGSAFSKTEPDPLTGLPIPRFIKPQDFVVDVNCASVLSSKRITHIERFSKKEIIQMERAGKFLKHYTKTAPDDDVDENQLQIAIDEQEGIDRSATEEKDRLLVYPRMYVELDSDDLPFLKRYDQEADEDEESDNSLPKPYKVAIARNLSDVVDIRRNWVRGDDTYKRDECFTGYKYLEGFGLMGLGLIHLAGSTSLALTSILRQTIIATMYKNFPAGFISKDVKPENNDVELQIGEFRAIETGEKPIQACISPLPYNGADPVMLSIYEKLEKKVGDIAASAQAAIPDNGGVNVAPGTAIAYMEAIYKVQSTVLESAHSSLGNELQLIFKFFKRYFKNESYYPFKTAGQTSYISSEDFTDDVNIIPVSNPKIVTPSHQIALAQLGIEMEKQAPELFVKREIYKDMLLAVNKDGIDRIMKPEPVPESSDPISENMMILKNMPVLVNIDQQHDAHIMIKGQFATEQKLIGNIGAYISATENAQVHKACKAIQEMAMKVKNEYEQTMMTIPMEPNIIVSIQQNYQNKIQQFQALMQLPPKNLLKIPEIQNIVAEQDMKQLQEQQSMQQQKESSQVDPNHVMLLDVQQQAKAAELKHQEAMKKVEVDAYKATMSFNAVTEKTEADRDISKERNDTQLAIAGMKLKNEQERGKLNVKQRFQAWLSRKGSNEEMR